MTSSFQTDLIPDEEWTQQTDYLWTLGEKAILAINYTACDEKQFLENVGYTYLQYYTSIITSSTDEDYVLLDDADILIDETSLFVSYELYGIGTGNSLKTIKCLENKIRELSKS